jgi:hypothetical protein
MQSLPSVPGRIVRLPAARTLAEDVILVPGHADDCDMAGFWSFHEMLTKTRDIARAEVAIGLYHELKVRQPSTHIITEDTFLFTGRRIVRLGRYQDDHARLETYTKENPKGRNRPVCHLGLASAHDKLGNRAEALKYYKLSLEAFPGEPSLIDKVKELEKPVAAE